MRFGVIFKSVILLFLFLCIIIVFISGYSYFVLDKEAFLYYLALNKIEKIKSINYKEDIALFIKKLILTEISKEKLEYPLLLKLQTALDILNLLKDRKQFDDVSFFLRDALSIKEYKRNRILSKLDKLIARFLGDRFDRSIWQCKYNKTFENKLLEEISLAKDIEQLKQKLFDLVKLYINNNELSKAISVFKRMLELEPNNLEIEYRIGLLYKLNNEPDLAIEIFERLSRQNNYVSLYSKYVLAGLYESKNNFLKAKEIYDSVGLSSVDLSLLYLYYFKKGYLYLYHFDDYKASLNIYKDISTNLPRDNFTDYIENRVIKRIGLYYRDLGFSLLLQRKYPSALDSFEVALRINPLDGISYIGEAITYLKLGDKEKALELGLEAKRILPREALVLINLGYIYTYLKMFEEAKEEYKKCIAIYPQYKEPYYNLGYIYILENKLDLAFDCLNKAISLDPKFVEAYNNLGYIFWYKNLFTEAISNFKKAVELRGNFTTARFNLGLALVILGRYKEAKEQFVEILKYEPNNEVVKLTLREIEKLIEK